MSTLTLDFANPLHTFADSVSKTVDTDCYLLGSISNENDYATVTINNTVIYKYYGGQNVATNMSMAFGPLKVKSGDVIIIVGLAAGSAHLYAER